MEEIPFEEFAKIERFGQTVTITEKIHGTNAQILVTESLGVHAGSRNRWLTPEDDNYGFARFVAEKADVIRALLGPGRHYGEWYGLGINAGYGLKEKRFALFNTHRWFGVDLPLQFDVVPILYEGPMTAGALLGALSDLQVRGSVIAPGFMHPEGVVIRFNRTGVMMKQTFEQEDVAWVRRREVTPKLDRSEAEAICAPFWQPMRLEKLLSRDESLGRDYPASLPKLCAAYVADLQAETDGVDEPTWKIVKKNVFVAIKGMMREKGYSA